jgi:hypothetical protein
VKRKRLKAVMEKWQGRTWSTSDAAVRKEGLTGCSKKAQTRPSRLEGSSADGDTSVEWETTELCSMADADSDSRPVESAKEKSALGPC